MTSTTIAASATAMALDDIMPSAVPTLKVMRLQAPKLLVAGGLTKHSSLSSNLMLPDSFGVISIGETFSAYLGVLNSSLDMPVRGLTVSAQLQTPSRRIVLPSHLDNTPTIQLQGSGGVDAIVSRRLEEAGPHILRVEVGYISNGAKSLRKFYRFNVTEPLVITESVTRSGDANCLVSVRVQNILENSSSGAVTISDVAFEASPGSGLVSKQIILDNTDTQSGIISALDLYDSCGRLEPGECQQFLFNVKAESEAASLRGIAMGDDLGQASLTYQRAMGETGVINSSVVVCPTSYSPDQNEGGESAAINFVVHRSGLSVDVAAAAAQRPLMGQGNSGNRESLDEKFPVTVEPMSPPSAMKLSTPQKISLLVVNHSSQAMNLQLQMRFSAQQGVVVCGQSFVSIGEIGASGGSTLVDLQLVAIVAGLLTVTGCFIVDLSTGMELKQPDLFQVYVN